MAATMCFIPYLATKTAPVLVPHDQHPPGTALHPVRPDQQAILDKFTLSHAAEIKLAIGCGCWLRHVDCEDPEYHVELLLTQPDYDPSNEQDNHDSLADYLQTHFRQDGFVEFFGYFNGDASQPVRAQKEIPVAAIRHPQFHFHGGTLYRLAFE